jgi:DNA-binding response OmpR family regulator
MRILLIEDDTRLGRVIEQGLQESGYAVDRAENGVLGLDLATLVTYDLAILEWMLPGMAGIDICRKLRAHGN